MSEHNIMPAAPAGAEGLGNYLAILRRRRAGIAATLALVLLAGGVATILTRPTYQATVRVLVEPPKTNINTVDTSNPLADLLESGQQPTQDTHVKLLQSQRLQNEVAAQLGIPLKSLPALTVEAVKDTDIIEVSAEDRDKTRAALVANTLVNTYLSELRETNTSDLERALRFTTAQAQVAQQTLDGDERALRDFQLTHHISDLEQSRDAQIRYLRGLESQRDKVAADSVANQAAIGATRGQLAREPATISPVVSATADPAVQALESQIGDLQAQDAGLAATYKPDYFKRAPGRARIAMLQKQLAAEKSSVRARNEQRNVRYLAMQNELKTLAIQSSVLGVQTREVTSRLTSARQELNSYSIWQVAADSLHRQLELARANYQMLSQKRDDLKLRVQTPRVNARVVEAAWPPKKPIRPNKMQNFVFAFVLGLCLAWGLALWQEGRDDRIGSADEAARALPLPSVGQLPRFAGQLPAPDEIDPCSPLAEAYRRLATTIGFCAGAAHNAAPILAFTSAASQEGRSTTVAYLAAVAALDGKRVLVVDADFRSPAQHALFGVSGPGLSEYLLCRNRLYDVIHSTRLVGVWVIPAGTSARNPAGLLRSKMLPELLREVRHRADLILIDAPAAEEFVDASLIAALADGVVFVGDLNIATRSGCRAALESLFQARAHLVGVIFNKITGREAIPRRVGALQPLPAREPEWQPGALLRAPQATWAEKTLRMARSWSLAAPPVAAIDAEGHQNGAGRPVLEEE